jgi:hypothetical protein
MARKQRYCMRDVLIYSRNSAFTDPAYLSSIRRQIANSTRSTVEATTPLIISTKRRSRPSKTTNKESKSKSRLSIRLRLDEALSQLDNADPETMFEGWSAARVRAYKSCDTNPNSYYYRFNAPGEAQKNGQWTPEERRKFTARLAELGGANGQWGLFSMAIKGRVGYQCSNYYRGLIKSGGIVDPNYEVDAKGKIHYLFGKKEGGSGVVRTHNKKGGSDAGKSKRKRKAEAGDDGEEEEVYPGEEISDESAPRPRTRTRGHVVDQETGLVDNPLPGFIDPITLDQVVRPTISPQGMVMGYDSWIKCLSNPKQRDTCPLTKVRLGRRDLVELTLVNIEEFR